MRLTFPRMGQIDIPVKTLFTELGHEVGGAASGDKAHF